jgi:hypothetical protein
MYVVGINNECGNYLGPWDELDRRESFELAQARARELAEEMSIKSDSGFIVFATEEGEMPKWACTSDEHNLHGGWVPTLSLPVG